MKLIQLIKRVGVKIGQVVVFFRNIFLKSNINLLIIIYIFNIDKIMELMNYISDLKKLSIFEEAFMLNKIQNLVVQEEGQGMTEYGLLLGVVVVVVVAALATFQRRNY